VWATKVSWLGSPSGEEIFLFFKMSRLVLGSTQSRIKWAPAKFWVPPSLVSSGHRQNSGVHPASYQVGTGKILGPTQPRIKWAPEKFWGPPSLVSSEHRQHSGAHPTSYQVGTGITAESQRLEGVTDHMVSRLNICGGIPPLLHTLSRRAPEQLSCLKLEKDLTFTDRAS